MKKVIKKVLWILAFSISSGSALFAQSFPGTWQGGLKVPQAPNGGESLNDTRRQNSRASATSEDDGFP